MRKIFNYTINSLKNSDFIQDIIKHNWKPYMVGGCVRDYIMNLTPHDIDIIVVGCDKEELIKVLNKYGKSDLVGESFAVIKYNFKGEIYDISTPRTEKKIGDGHKGFEVITNKNITLEQDLFRRDITINSITLDFNGNFVDPFGGIDDIKNKKIKITNPDAFINDPLRILRVCRFCARLDFTIDNETTEMMNKIKPFIKELSQERIHEEWNKTIEHAVKGGVNIMQKYIDLLTEYDMWEQMFPGMKIDTNIKVQYLDNAIIFLDLFTEHIKSKRKFLIGQLKFTTEVVNEMEFLQEIKTKLIEKGYDNPFVRSVYTLAKLKERYHIDDDLILRFIDHNLKSYKNIIDSFIKYCNDGFVADGNELMKQGLKGRAIEDEKDRIEVERFKTQYLN